MEIDNDCRENISARESMEKKVDCLKSILVYPVTKISTAAFDSLVVEETISLAIPCIPSQLPDGSKESVEIVVTGLARVWN